MFKKLKSHIKAIQDRDPSIHGETLTIILSYPSFHAMCWYEISHWLWQRKFRGLSRFISNISRVLTSIDIHPGATIGHGFFIDHGIGVVIGETAVVGDNVTLYQGVTLGGTNPAQESAKQRQTKRHPTLCDGVIVGSGAQILGDVTIGVNCSIGANAVVVNDAPDGCVMVGIPAKAIHCPDGSKRGAYGTIDGKCPDLLNECQETLLTRIQDLETEIKTLKTLSKK